MNVGLAASLYLAWHGVLGVLTTRMRFCILQFTARCMRLALTSWGIPLTLTGGSRPDTLVSVTSPGLRIELHGTTMDSGVMKMAKRDTLPVPAGAKVALATGGNHLMIFGLTSGAKSVPLKLAFRSGAKVATLAEVRAPAATAPDPHAGHVQH